MGTRVKSIVLRTLKWLLKADFAVSSEKWLDGSDLELSTKVTLRVWFRGQQ